MKLLHGQTKDRVARKTANHIRNKLEERGLGFSEAVQVIYSAETDQEILEAMCYFIKEERPDIEDPKEEVSFKVLSALEDRISDTIRMYPEQIARGS